MSAQSKNGILPREVSQHRDPAPNAQSIQSATRSVKPHSSRWLNRRRENLFTPGARKHSSALAQTQHSSNMMQRIANQRASATDYALPTITGITTTSIQCSSSEDAMTVRASSKDVCSVSFSQRSGLVLEDNYDNLLSAAMLHVPSRLEISPETFTLFRDVVDEHGAMLADDNKEGGLISVKRIGPNDKQYSQNNQSNGDVLGGNKPNSSNYARGQAAHYRLQPEQQHPERQKRATNKNDEACNTDLEKQEGGNNRSQADLEGFKNVRCHRVSYTNNDGKPNSLSSQKSHSMPHIPGGPKPVNRLKESAAPISRSHISNLSKSFDLVRAHAEESHRSNKRQKTDHTRSVEPPSEGTIDLETGLPTNKRSSTTPSRPSHSQNEQSKKPMAGLPLGKSHTRTEAEMFPKARRRTRRQSSGAHVEYQRPWGGGQFQKTHASGLVLNDDPITSDDDILFESKVSGITPSHKNVGRSKYLGTADLQIQKSTKPSKSKIEVVIDNNPKLTGDTRSHYFQDSNSSRVRSSTSSLASKAKRDFNDSLDDLSKDHYVESNDAVQKPALSKSEREGVQHEKKVRAVVSGRSDDFMAGLQSDSEEDRNKKATIKKSVFTKGMSRSTGKLEKEIFKVSMAFSEQTRWLMPNEKSSWTLEYDPTSTEILLLNSDGDRQWELYPGAFSKLEFSSSSPKMIAHKSRNNVLGIRLHFQFEDVEQRDNFRELLRATSKGISDLHRSPEYMEKVFEQTLQNLDGILRKKRKFPDAAADIKLIEANRQRHLDKATSNVETRTGSTAYHIQKNAVTPAHQHHSVPSVARSMRSRSDIEKPAQSQQSIRQHEPIDAADFYNADDTQDRRHSTRSSEKPVTQPRPRTPTPPPTWTQLNPEWAFNWKSSLVYPSEGPKKATVDLQDIQRLDEGEFLNDNLIAFYFRWLEEKLKQRNPELSKRVYFQNTFFYERLAKNPPKGKRINYEAVQRWTAKVNLLDYDYIIVPVNENTHWYVAIIYKARKLLPPETMPESVAGGNINSHKQSSPLSKDASASAEPICLDDDDDDGPGNDRIVSAQQSNDTLEKPQVVGEDETTVEEINNSHQLKSEPPIVSDIVLPKSEKLAATGGRNARRKSNITPRNIDLDAPRIIILDSLGLSHSGTCSNLKAYLAAEIKAKQGKDIDPPQRIGLTAKHIPLQDNYCDCGLFLLMYIEMFLRTGDGFIHDLLRGTSNLDIDWETASQLRHSIRTILFELQAEQVSANKRLKKEKEKLKRGTPQAAELAETKSGHTSKVAGSTTALGNSTGASPMAKMKNVGQSELQSPILHGQRNRLPPTSPQDEAHQVVEIDDSQADQSPLLPHEDSSVLPLDHISAPSITGRLGRRNTMIDDRAEKSHAPSIIGRTASSNQTTSKSKDSRNGKHSSVEITESPDRPMSSFSRGSHKEDGADFLQQRHTSERHLQGTRNNAIEVNEEDDPEGFVQLKSHNSFDSEGRQQKSNDAEMLLDDSIDNRGDPENPVTLSESTQSTQSSPVSEKKSNQGTTSTLSNYGVQYDGAMDMPCTFPPADPNLSATPNSQKRKSAPVDEEDEDYKGVIKGLDPMEQQMVRQRRSHNQKAGPGKIQRKHTRFT